MSLPAGEVEAEAAAGDESVTVLGEASLNIVREVS
jgi:hypothetical protein